MATTITIPACGWNVGTCGWLAAGLADGTIRINTGVTKSGDGGLWLHWEHGGKKHQGCLAIWNEYDLSPAEYPNAERFAVYCGDTGNSFAGACPLTPAAEQFLRDAAQAWCDEANERRASDNATLPVVRIA